MKSTKRTIPIIIIAVAAVIGATVLLYPTIYDHQCKTRVYEDLQAELTDDVMGANIVIVQEKVEKESDAITHLSYSVGASGVIFSHKGNKYYALTANHVVADGVGTEWIVIPYGSETYREYVNGKEEHVPQEEYYNQYSRGKVVASDEASDLAVLAFESKQQFPSLALSTINPSKDSRIAVIGNPDGERFVQSYGNIKSDELFTFETEDGLPPAQTLKHNAYEAPGSSGGVCLDEEKRIVGINIGGGTDALGRFKYGVMVPCEIINSFLDKTMQEQE